MFYQPDGHGITWLPACVRPSTGMPVEAFLKTDDRTVLSYLVKPVSDQIAHALKDR